MGHRYLLLFTAASISFSFEREKGTIDSLSPLTLNAMREAEILYMRPALVREKDFS